MSNLVVIRNTTPSGYFSQMISAVMEVDESYFVMVNGTNSAGLSTVTFAQAVSIVDPSDTAVSTDIALVVGVSLGVGLPLLCGFALVSTYLARRMRLERQKQARIAQQLQALQDALDAMAQQQQAFRGVHKMDELVTGAPDQMLEELKAVAIVVTDLEASTAAAKADPETYKEVQRSHDQSMREMLATFNGIEIMTRGDSFTIVFFSVAAAVKWAVAVQHRLLRTSWPKAVYKLPANAQVLDAAGNLMFSGPRVRMGIHWATEGAFTCTYAC